MTFVSKICDLILVYGSWKIAASTFLLVWLLQITVCLGTPSNTTQTCSPQVLSRFQPIFKVSTDAGSQKQLMSRLDDVIGILQGMRPRNCAEVLARYGASGKYLLYDGYDTFEAYCDMKTDGGGWTVFQRRQDGSLDFYRNWTSYKVGFGQVDGEHWLGNELLYRLTNSPEEYELRIDLEDWTGETRYAAYDRFLVGDERDKYQLTLGNYSGTAGDAMVVGPTPACNGTCASLSGAMFSTYDEDNDGYLPVNCTEDRGGAWWYKGCTHSNLNGPYRQGGTYNSRQIIEWAEWKGTAYSLKKTEMKIRPIDRNRP